MKKLKRILSVMLVIALTLGVIPISNVQAATKKVELDKLKDYGKVTIGDKSNDEWFRFKLGSAQAFCLDMGEACHSGYTYKSSSKTYYTYKGSDKHKKIAKIGAWFTNPSHPNRATSNKYFVIMQILLWGVEEGYSDSDLKKLTKTALNLVDKDNADLYEDIFETDARKDVELTIWEYQGEDDDQVQKLLEFEQSETATPEWEVKPMTEYEYYRQRLNVIKTDEIEKPVSNVKFNITAKNVMQLHSYAISDADDSGENTSAADLTKFNMDTVTADNGRINMRFTYKVSSETYWYIVDIDKLDSASLKEAKAFLDDNDYGHGKDYTQAQAESLATSNLTKQMSKISNQYIVKEVGSDDKTLVISDEWKKGKTITIGADNSWTRDADGNWPDNTSKQYSAYPLAVNQRITNEHKLAKWTLQKTGEQLTAFDETKGFIFEKKSLKGVLFDVNATSDIIVNGKKYFSKGDKVAEITTGEGVTFTNKCDDKCTATLAANGNIVMTMPMGNYEVKETQTVKNHILPNKTWSFVFDGAKAKDTDTVVYDYGTCVDGVFNLNNSLVGTSVKMVKVDGNKKTPLAEATFGFYTKDDVYNVDGEVIVTADTKIATVTTGEDGIATVPFQIPLMDDKNTGDYYFIEEAVPEGYLLDPTPVDVHLESADDKETVEVEAEMDNYPTGVEIDKLSMVDSTVLDDCDMKVTDVEQKDIVTWTTGNPESITKTEDYKNLEVEMHGNGNVVVSGLHENEEYTLHEERAKDGYLIANDIVFKLQYAKDEDGKAYTKVFVKNENDEFVETSDNRVVMLDDITKIDLSKKGITGDDEIPGCEMELESDGAVIDKWTSGDTPHRITGLTIGKTYTLIERRPADGFATAANVDFVVQDTGEVQTVVMHDETIKVKLVKVDSKDENKKLPGAEFVFKKDGKKVATVTTDKNGEALLEGVLAAGTTYDVIESKAPEGYQKKEPFKIKVKDTGEVQVFTVKDKRDGTATPDTPHWTDSGAKSPKTGDFRNPWIVMMILLSSVAVAMFSAVQLRRVGNEE